MTSSDLEWLSEIFNDTKHRMVSLQQLSFLSRWWPYAILNLHNLEFVMWLLSPCYSAYRRRNLLKLDSWLLKVVIKRFSIWRPSANLNFKNFHIWSHLCHRVQVCCCVPNFIKIGWFFIEIWRFNDFQDGGCFHLEFYGSSNGFFFEKPIWDWSSIEIIAINCFVFWENLVFCTHFGDRQRDNAPWFFIDVGAL